MCAAPSGLSYQTPQKGLQCPSTSIALICAATVNSWGLGLGGGQTKEKAPPVTRALSPLYRPPKAGGLYLVSANGWSLPSLESEPFGFRGWGGPDCKEEEELRAARQQGVAPLISTNIQTPSLWRGKGLERRKTIPQPLADVIPTPSNKKNSLWRPPKARFVCVWLWGRMSSAQGWRFVLLGFLMSCPSMGRVF